MDIKIKNYSSRIKNNGGKVATLIRWNRTFLSSIVDLSSYGDFSATDIQSYFDNHSLYLSLNTIRLKLHRLYKKGILNRRLTLKEINKGGRSYYVYIFSDYGKEFIKKLGVYPKVELHKRLPMIEQEIERRQS